ncbi:MAG: Flp pilus assembly complex ATPase component TadA [Oscillospiraceae bacterium]|nr:Flp pilus assembly complex ATPase component TadA [Oscillospiraceae bacterium]
MSVINSIDEIRLRINKPISLSVLGRNEITCMLASESDIEHTFKTAFSYSLHSYSKELSNGYIATKGGNRVGICGTAVIPNTNHNLVDTVKYISSINIRISREVTGCADNLISACNFPCGILIIGPPASGKTTLLRDLARIIGASYRVSLIDEQNEISATYRNQVGCDVGCLTDVFVGYPKHIGITTAVKVMSPNVVIVDEIGTADDLKALDYALHSGAKLVTAIHSDSLESAVKKPGIKHLIDTGAFDYCAVLEPYSCTKHSYKVIKLD